MEHGHIVKLGDWINKGWNLFSNEWKTWSLMGLISMLPMVLFIFVFYVFYFLFLISRSYPRSMGSGSMLTMVALFVGAGLLLMLYVAYVSCGMYQAALKQVRGETIEVSDIWRGGSYVLPMILLYVMNIFLTCIGALLCFFPAFIVQGLVFLSYPILIGENAGPVEALQKSWNLAKSDWLMFTIFALVVGIISQIGSYACFVGIFFTFPFQFILAAVSYHDCFQSGTAAVSEPAGERKKCKNCGRSIPGNANFCDNCGANQL
jgi:hypothetical protein